MTEEQISELLSLLTSLQYHANLTNHILLLLVAAAVGVGVVVLLYRVLKRLI